MCSIEIWPTIGTDATPFPFPSRHPATRRRSLARRLLVVLGAMLFALVVAAAARVVTFRGSVGGLEFAKPQKADQLEMLLPQACLREPVPAVATAS